MKVIETASAKRNYGNGIKPCMVFVFDTGHKMIKWNDGTEFHFTKNGTALSERTGTKLIPEMQRLAALEFGA